MVEHSTYDPEIKGSNPDIGHWERENMAGYNNDPCLKEFQVMVNGQDYNHINLIYSNYF